MTNKRPPEVSDIVTDNFLSGRMTNEERRDLMATDGPEDSDCYQWRENGMEHRKWNNGAREYRCADTQWRWQIYIAPLPKEERDYIAQHGLDKF